MKPPQSHKPFLILAVAVTLLVLVLYAYMYWQVTVSVSKAVTARELAMSEEDHKKKENDLVRLYDSTAEERARLSDYFISYDKTVQFIEALEAVGTSTGADVTLASIDADHLDKSKPGSIGFVKAHIDARGSWTSVWKVLLIAERLPYKLVINNVHMDATTVAPGTANKTPQKGWHISFDISAVITVPTSSATTSTTTPTT